MSFSASIFLNLWPQLNLTTNLASTDMQIIYYEYMNMYWSELWLVSLWSSRDTFWPIAFNWCIYV